jgi:hypothetical protein
MKNFLWLPIIIFLILFGIDKLFLIPVVNNLLVKQESNGYFAVANFENQKYEERKKIWTEQIGGDINELEKKAIVFIGTSRAEGFGLIGKEHIVGSPYLKDEKKVLEIPVTSRIIKAGTFMHLYMLYTSLINENPNIKKIALEINYASLNRKSNVRQRKEITDLSRQEFFELMPYLSYRDIVEYFSSHLFVVNKLQIKWKNIYKGKDNESTELADNLFLLQKILGGNKKTEIQGFQIDGVKEGQESEERIYAYKEHIKHDTNLLFLNYEMNPTEFELLLKIIKEAKAKGIQLTLYKPKIHNLYSSSTAKYQPGEKKFFEEIQKISEINYVKFIDLNENETIQCNYFGDPSHISTYCMPEIVEKIYNLW